MTHENTNTWQSVKPAAVASWLKEVMEEAGIDTNKFTVHSIRSASSTKAVTMGSEIDQVKMHVN
jgi:site-specific recombinase XerD